MTRKTNGPSLAGSPSRTAIIAPFGNDGGMKLTITLDHDGPDFRIAGGLLGILVALAMLGV